MNWELFYLVCFVVGFSFSVLSFVGGLHRFHFHHFNFHFPKHLHLGGLGHGSAHGLGGAAGSTGVAHGGAHGGHAATTSAHFPFINPMTMAAFLTWFGGTGYLLVHLRHIWVFAGVVLASVSGFLAASIVFLFVAKVLMANDQEIDPMDYEMVGVLGRISVPVRADGTGEMIFEQMGIRKPCAARSEHGEPLAKGEEVVVTRYERGVAYVRRWEELANPGEASSQATTKRSS
jgi:membrane protein implicated in regulation of membrane protease activity